MRFIWPDAKSDSLIPQEVATSPEGAEPMSHRACFLLKRSQKSEKETTSAAVNTELVPETPRLLLLQNNCQAL